MKWALASIPTCRTNRMPADSRVRKSPAVVVGCWRSGDRLILKLVSGLFCWTVVALVLGVIGLFHWWLVVPISLAAFLVVRSAIPRATGRLDGWWFLAITVAVLSFALNGLNAGEHLLTGRDSGTYMATAGWLAENSTLNVDARRGPLGEVDGLGYVLPGFYEWGDNPGDLEPQFMHAFPALLGTLVDVGGLGLAYWLNPLLGAIMLLLLFSLARRFMAAWAALLAVLTVASGLVFLYFARTPFSEMLMAVFLLGGLVTLGEAEERVSNRLALIGGALLGATVLARLDGVVVLIPVLLYLSVRSRTGPVGLAVTSRSARRAALAIAVLGLAESVVVSPAYIFDRSVAVAAPLIVVLLLMVGDDLVGNRLCLFWRTRVIPHRAVLLRLVIFVSGLLLAYAWFIRPQITPGRLIGGDLAFVEAREGLTTDPLPYHAMAVQWLSWYHGPGFVGLAWVGMIGLVRRGSESPSRDPSWLVPAILGTFSTLYIWRPLITPDHIWAMRRFLTVVIPLGALAAAFAVCWISGAIRRLLAGWVRPFKLTLASLLLIPPVLTTSPVWSVHEFDGLTVDMEEMCGDLTDNASVLVIDYELAQYLAQSLRSYCGVSAAWTESVSNSELEEIRSTVESGGGTLAVLSLDGPGSIYLDGDYRRLEITLSHAPSSTSSFPVSIAIDS